MNNENNIIRLRIKDWQRMPMFDQCNDNQDNGIDWNISENREQVSKFDQLNMN